MTGNLSHQIEHHLFPDLPSNRYAEIAPQVQDVFERYGLTYTTGSLPQQVASRVAQGGPAVAAQRLREGAAGDGHGAHHKAGSPRARRRPAA